MKQGNVNPFLRAPKQLFPLLILLTVIPSPSWAQGPRIEDWGKLENGETVRLLSLDGEKIGLKIATLGAQIVSLSVRDSGGEKREVVLAHATLEEALTRGTLGAVIGRYANRISGGGFSIDGKRHDLESVNRKTGIQIHGGRTGFDRQNWEIENDPESIGFPSHPRAVTLRLSSPDGHEGFPGNLWVWVQYRVDDAPDGSPASSNPVGTFEWEFRARCDAPTQVNLTNHAYFNLEGKGTVLHHALQLNCDEMLEFDPRRIPTGKILSVEGTRFDFRHEVPRVLGGDAPESFEGLDHCFVVRDDGNVGTLVGTGSDLLMSVWTSQPGVQIYTANHFRGKPFPRFGAICFETQHYPDTPNRPEFPSTLLRPGEWLIETTRFTFRTLF